MIRTGDLVEFKRRGPVSAVLGGLLHLIDRSWDAWGWHLAVIWEKSDLGDGWYIMEALSGGVETNYYSMEDIRTRCRVYHWLDQEPDAKSQSKFLKGHLGKDYDVAVYFWTSLQYLIRHFINRRIPRLLDERFTCWELMATWCDFMGKPVHSKYDCPMISDIIKKIQGSRINIDAEA